MQEKPLWHLSCFFHGHHQLSSPVLLPEGPRCSLHRLLFYLCCGACPRGTGDEEHRRTSLPTRAGPVSLAIKLPTPQRPSFTGLQSDYVGFTRRLISRRRTTRIIRSDHGSNLISAQIRSWCASKGIDPQPTSADDHHLSSGQREQHGRKGIACLHRVQQADTSGVSCDTSEVGLWCRGRIRRHRDWANAAQDLHCVKPMGRISKPARALPAALPPGRLT